MHKHRCVILFLFVLCVCDCAWSRGLHSHIFVVSECSCCFCRLVWTAGDHWPQTPLHMLQYCSCFIIKQNCICFSTSGRVSKWQCFEGVCLMSSDLCLCVFPTGLMKREEHLKPSQKYLAVRYVWKGMFVVRMRSLIYFVSFERKSTPNPVRDIKFLSLIECSVHSCVL